MQGRQLGRPLRTACGQLEAGIGELLKGLGQFLLGLRLLVAPPADLEAGFLELPGQIGPGRRKQLGGQARPVTDHRRDPALQHHALVNARALAHSAPN